MDSQGKGSGQSREKAVNVQGKRTVDTADTAVHRTVDTAVHRTVDTAVHRTVDIAVHRTVDTAVHRIVDTAVHRTVDTAVHRIEVTTTSGYLQPTAATRPDGVSAPRLACHSVGQGPVAESARSWLAFGWRWFGAGWR